MTAASRGLATAGRWFVASMVCALVAHAAVYRSLVPDDGLHGYFGWYVPLVAVASLGSLLAVVVGGLCPGSRRGRVDPALSACALDRVSRRNCRVCLASGGLAFLVVQESLERSLDAGAFSLVTFDASTWPVLLVVLVLAAAAVLAVGRTAVVLSERTFTVRRLWVPMTRVLPCPGSGRGCGSEVGSAGVARGFACASSRGLISRAREGRSFLTTRPEREFAQLAVPTCSWIAVPSPASGGTSLLLLARSPFRRWRRRTAAPR